MMHPLQQKWVLENFQINVGTKFGNEIFDNDLIIVYLLDNLGNW